MIDNWAYYCGFFPTPFTETVGVGFEARQVTLNTQSELIQFLLSDESLKLYNSSSVDLANLANMFGFRIAIFEHGKTLEMISFQGGPGSHLTKKSLSSVLTEIKAYRTCGCTTNKMYIGTC